jgi:hypothetical protein
MSFKKGPGDLAILACVVQGPDERFGVECMVFHVEGGAAESKRGVGGMC